MLINQLNKVSSNDNENLPDTILVRFQEIKDEVGYPKVRVTLNGELKGDVIDDNSFQNDGYRYHDVFHYTFATLLDWSPCARAMLKKKRKSNAAIDRIEDGARSTTTEEAISLMIFEEAKLNNFYSEKSSVCPVFISIIKQITSNYEVKDKTPEQWENAILTGYKMFRELLKNKGGEIFFDRKNKIINYNLIVN